MFRGKRARLRVLRESPRESERIQAVSKESRWREGENLARTIYSLTNLGKTI